MTSRKRRRCRHAYEVCGPGDQVNISSCNGRRTSTANAHTNAPSSCLQTRGVSCTPWMDSMHPLEEPWGVKTAYCLWVSASRPRSSLWFLPHRSSPITPERLPYTLGPWARQWPAAFVLLPPARRKEKDTCRWIMPNLAPSIAVSKPRHHSVL